MQLRAMATVALPGLSDLKPVLPRWAKIVNNVENFQTTSTTEEKMRCLANTVVDLRRLDAESQEDFREEPERSMLGEIAARWLDTVNDALDELHGRADLRMSMPTRRVLALDNVIVASGAPQRGQRRSPERQGGPSAIRAI